VCEKEMKFSACQGSEEGGLFHFREVTNQITTSRVTSCSVPGKYYIIFDKLSVC
jgi:hypothetical protein